MPASLLQPLADRSYRVALLLTGNTKSARKIVAWLVERYPSKGDDEAIDRWFRHHTLLRSREMIGGSSLGQDGVYAPTGDARKDAFSKAVASLPAQQREAWLLSVVEGFAPRTVGAAMDLSTTAANNHLGAAEKQLASLAGDQFLDLEAAFTKSHRATVAPSGLLEGAVARRSRRRNFRRIKQLFVLLLAIAFCFGCLYVLKLSGQLVPFVEFVSRQFGSSSTTQP